MLSLWLLVMVKVNVRHRLLALTQNYLPNLGNYKWAKYLLLFWAIRMSFLVISLLFPILSALGPSPETDLYQYEIPIAKLDEANFETLLSARTPFIIHDFSVPLGQEIGQILDLELPRLLTNVKVSRNPEFIHFSPNQSWSSKVNLSCTHTLENMDVTEFLKHRSNLSDQVYVYLSRKIRDPSSSIIIQTLSPNFIHLPINKGVTPEVRLWMSSRGVIASPHYDMEHNYFLQLNGTKKFILSSPIHYEVFQPYSYLHPHWRQSQHLELLNVSIIQSSAKFSEKKRSKKRKVADESSESCQIGKNNSALFSSVHEVILTPGQLLYIPPFHFHSVIAMDEYSVSINAWVGSEYVLAAERLRFQIPLPFHSSGDISEKLSSIGNLIKTVINRLLLPFPLEDIKSNFLSRVDSTFIELNLLKDYCSSISPYSECTVETVRVAGNLLCWYALPLSRI